MADPIQTETAKLSLDGQNIYTNCCTLRIDYSKLPHLNVRFNNLKSRDYTRHDLPSGDGTSGAMSGMVPGQMIQNQSQLQHMHVPMQHAQMMPNPHMGHMGGQLQVNGGRLQTFQTQQHTNPSVLLVSNLDQDSVTCYDLFILFGVYGNVVRVKILYNKPDNALLQMSDSQQAQTALVNLNNMMLHGRTLRIVHSKHQQVQMPKEGQEAANLTKDYSNSPLHRFKKPGSKNFNNLFPPSATLHLSNIPGEILEEDLREKF
jgi:hnRNP-L/PTB/hephaestus splicing factor